MKHNGKYYRKTPLNLILQSQFQITISEASINAIELHLVIALSHGKVCLLQELMDSEGTLSFESI